MEAPNVYQLTNAGTAPRFNEAFVKGCPGAKLITDGVLRPGPVALWGEHKWWRTLQAAIAEGRTWYYGDHAYFGRGFFYRVTKNALQIDGADFAKDERANAARYDFVSTQCRQFGVGEIKIFSRQYADNGFVMICPPSEPLSERSGFTQAEWIERTVAKVKAATTREVRIRYKPKVNRTPAPLLEAMQGAWCAVTYTSNVATEVMLGGYPCFIEGPHPASVFGNTDFAKIESPYLPDPATLKVWAGFLCRHQWTIPEIARGDCWKAIQ